MILALQTNSFSAYGGIPTYNRLVCRVLDALGCKEGNSVLIAMDKDEDVGPAGTLHPNLHISGFGGNRARFAATALNIAARKRIDLVLAGHINYVPLCLLLKVLRPHLRIGVFIYGWDVWYRIPLMQRLALRQADFFISISAHTKQQAVAVNGLSARRTFLLPNAIQWSTEGIDAAQNNHSTPQKVKLLSVGRLDAAEQQKGFDTVIESLPAVVSRVPDLQYTIVGEGNDLQRHKQLAAKVGVADHVQFLGSLNEATLRECYRSCDVFVMPSAQEGFGFVYLEAMASAKAVVAARSGGVPEVVKHDETGLLVEYGDVEQLATAIITLCVDSKLRTRLGEAGYRRLQQNFTFAHFKRRLNEIIMRQPTKDVGGNADQLGDYFSQDVTSI